MPDLPGQPKIDEAAGSARGLVDWVAVILTGGCSGLVRELALGTKRG
jgi:hypothetical protein